MSMDLGEALSSFLRGLEEVLQSFEAFFQTPEIERLKEISSLMVVLGRIHHSNFRQMSHGILTSSVIDAGLLLGERIRTIESRGLREDDIIYLREIYDLFRLIADKIASGEYEKGLRAMKR